MAVAPSYVACEQHTGGCFLHIELSVDGMYDIALLPANSSILLCGQPTSLPVIYTQVIVCCRLRMVHNKVAHYDCVCV
jgi:hypothetical protein